VELIGIGNAVQSLAQGILAIAKGAVGRRSVGAYISRRNLNYS
jgi:hypothetical protein